jgi:hypothetical protein
MQDYMFLMSDPSTFNNALLIVMIGYIDGVRRSMTNHGLTEEDTRDRDRWRNLVLGEGNPL